MNYSDAEIRHIVERSAFLYERLKKTSFVTDNATAANSTSNQMAEWCQRAALGDWANFTKRLEWDGLDLTNAGCLASGFKLPDEEPLPPWTDCIRHVLEQSSVLAEQSLQELVLGKRFFKAEEPIGFEHLLIAFVDYASSQVSARAQDADELLTSEARAQIERGLLVWLAPIASEAFFLEFSVFRALKQEVSGVLWGAISSASPANDIYARFVREMFEGGLLKLFTEYPVLARLLAESTEMWAASIARFLSRLKNDTPEIEARLNQREPLGQVVEALSGLSDRHERGETSVRVTFHSGLQVIYKPKDVRPEEAFYNLLSWLNKKGAPLQFRIFGGVYRDSHGWIEVVPMAPCLNREEVARYYYRAGMLLCLVYALEGSDCHHENIIASGEHPVLIDMETLLQPRVRTIVEETENAASMANRMFYWDSVFRTAFLPRWDFGQNGESYDISGLGGVEGQQTSFIRKTWEHPNSNLMRAKSEALFTRPNLNVVKVDGQRMDPANYVPQLTEGFRAMYQLLGSRSEELFSEGAPLAAMAGMRFRFIFRNTKIYAIVLKNALRSQSLRDGLDTSIQAEVLCRPLLSLPTKHVFWDIIAAEEEALLRGDIPLFSTLADKTDLMAGDTCVVPSFFEESGFDLLKKRFEKLSESDMRKQIAYIAASFNTRQEAKPASESASVTAHDETVGTPKSFLVEALAIAAAIEENAIGSEDGSSSWITLAYYAEAQRWQVQPMSPRLYDGASGTCLFLAALESVTGGAGYHSLALSALHMLAEPLHRADYQRYVLEAGIGAGLGGASLVYVFARASQFLKEDSLLDDAERAAELITAERIQSDRRFDLLGGASGALVALLSLHALRPSGRWLERAILCGESLLANREQTPSGHRVWRTLNGEFLTGYSHGAAGIAQSLARLYQATGEAKYKDAAAEAVEYENATFSAATGNWPDLRFPRGKNGYVFNNTWCHGAPGIGLGRLELLSVLDQSRIRADIDVALHVTELEKFSNLDHLCCGNLGRAEFLLTAGRKLGLAKPEQQGRALAGLVVQRAREQGRYSMGWESGPYIPSFHQGMAGVGYQLLRFAAPDLVPSALTWE